MIVLIGLITPDKLNMNQIDKVLFVSIIIHQKDWIIPVPGSLIPVIGIPGKFRA
jgi:hypothetical protein